MAAMDLWSHQDAIVGKLGHCGNCVGASHQTYYYYFF